jgi:hypothetical protein
LSLEFLFWKSPLSGDAIKNVVTIATTAFSIAPVLLSDDCGGESNDGTYAATPVKLTMCAFSRNKGVTGSIQSRTKCVIVYPFVLALSPTRCYVIE